VNACFLLDASLEDSFRDGRGAADNRYASFDWHSLGAESHSYRLYSQQGCVRQVPGHRHVDGMVHFFLGPRDAPLTYVVSYARESPSRIAGLVAGGAIVCRHQCVF
jgi:hypothetical protein